MNNTDFESSIVETPTKPTTRRSAKLTDWQQFFLDRLDTLLQHQFELQQQPEATEEQQQLLSRAIYSTFLDCQSEGVTELALQKLAARGSHGPSAN